MAIAHLAGDAGMFGDRHKPNGMLLREDFAGIDEDARAEILDTALRVLGDYRDGRISSSWRPNDDQLHSMLRFARGTAAKRCPAGALGPHQTPRG